MLCGIVNWVKYGAGSFCCFPSWQDQTSGLKLHIGERVVFCALRCGRGNSFSPLGQRENTFQPHFRWKRPVYSVEDRAPGLVDFAEAAFSFIFEPCAPFTDRYCNSCD